MARLDIYIHIPIQIQKVLSKKGNPDSCVGQ